MKKEKSRLPKILLFLVILVVVTLISVRYTKWILGFAVALYNKSGLIGIFVMVLLISFVLRMLSRFLNWVFRK